MRTRKAAVIAIAAASLLTAAALPAMTAAAATAAAAGRAAQAKVPWSKVGPGWVLDEYTVTSPKAGPAALYLFSPQGTRYQLASWPDSNSAPTLMAWSPALLLRVHVLPVQPERHEDPLARHLPRPADPLQRSPLVERRHDPGRLLPASRARLPRQHRRLAALARPGRRHPAPPRLPAPRHPNRPPGGDRVWLQAAGS